MSGHPDGGSREAMSSWLDLFRWISASIVVISHAGGILMVTLSELPPSQHTAAQFIYSFVAGFAHPAVMIFFVMSGYLVGGSFGKQILSGKPDYALYFSKRAARLLIVLIPALLLTVALQYVAKPIADDLAIDVYNKASSSADVGTFICNAAFLQNIFCSRFGGNDSLWSLTHEAWYYVAFPLIASAALPISWRARVFAVGSGFGILVLLNLLQRSNVPIAPYAFIWGLGAIVAIFPTPRRIPGPLVVGCVFIVVLTSVRIAATVFDQNTFSVFIMDFLVAGVFSALIWSMKVSKTLVSPMGGRWNKGMADFSFSLYCVHFPILMLYSTLSQKFLGYGYNMTVDNIYEWGVVFGGLASAFILAYLFSVITERNTEAVRRRIWGYWGRLKANAL